MVTLSWCNNSATVFSRAFCVHCFLSLQCLRVKSVQRLYGFISAKTCRNQLRKTTDIVQLNIATSNSAKILTFSLDIVLTINLDMVLTANFDMVLTVNLDMVINS